MRKVWVSWGALIALSLLTLPFINSHLTTTLRVPNSPSLAAQKVLQSEFQEDIEGTFTVIYHFRKASLKEVEGYKEKVKSAATVIPGAHVAVTRSLAGYFFATIQSPYELPVAATYTEDLRTSLERNGLKGSLVGGPPAIKSDVTPVLNSDLLRGELIGATLASLILLLLLGWTRILLVPFVFALAVTSISLGLVFLFSLIHPMALYLPNIISLFALGLSIDYALLVIYRYRQERSFGASHEEAMQKVRTSALATVKTSSLLVALCISFLLIIDVPFIRSIALGALFVPLISYLASFSLLPALLDTFGNKSDFTKFSLIQQRFAQSFSRKSLARPVVYFLVSVIALLALAYTGKDISPTPSSLTALPAQTQSAQALTTVSSRLGEGVITPHILIVKAPQADFQPLVKAIKRLDGVFTTAFEIKDEYLKLYVVTNYRLGSQEDQDMVKRLRGIHLDKFGIEKGEVYLAGAPAQGVDLLHAIGKNLWLIVIAGLLALFIGLLRTFSSFVLALKAIAMDVLSLLAVVGIVVTLTKFGVGTYKLPQVEAWSLLLALTILFGLSIDYELFIVSRIKEAHDEGKSNSEAIKIGLENTSVVVTAAGLILIAALSGFVFGHFAGVQQLGLGLLVGIIIDITLVRLLLLPAAMVLLGEWNWKKFRQKS